MNIRAYFFSFIFSIFFLYALFVAAAGADNKIMPLGDSITLGAASGVTDPLLYVSYRKELWDQLKAAGYVVDNELFVGTVTTSGTSVPDFDSDNEGHDGWQTDQIVNGNAGDPTAGKLGGPGGWLETQKPNIVLLHIGTNDISNDIERWQDVEALLTVIDDYEITSGNAVWVILSRIINRGCNPYLPPCPKSDQTSAFNDAVENFVFDPRQTGGDKIVLVGMEVGAGINYDRWDMGGDMFNDLHPYEFGYEKMADLWFSGLVQILPQADAGDPQTVKETVTVTLDGSNSSPAAGNNITTYLWEQTAGTLVTLSDETTAKPTFTAPNVTAAGETLIFKLTVTDNDGLVSTDTVSIDVSNTINPIANAGDDQNVTAGDTVTLDGTGSTDADGTIVSYLWEQTPVPTVTLTGASTPTATFTAPQVDSAGESLTFKLTVIDDDGLTSSDTMNVNVAEPLLAVAGDDQNVTVGDPVTLDGTDSTGPIASYMWIQKAGTPVQLSGADTAIATFTYNPGAAAAAVETLTFELTVEDNTGLIDSNDTVRVNVDDGIAPDTGGGGGGGGGCFIANVADGSQMAFHGEVLPKLRSRFAMLNWKRRLSGFISLLTPRPEHAATPALVITMVVLIGACAANTLRKPREKWLKS